MYCMKNEFAAGDLDRVALPGSFHQETNESIKALQLKNKSRLYDPFFFILIPSRD